MMKRMQNLLQDRKTLYLVLCIAVVSVFTLSIAYAAMSAVLEIHGNSEVVASSWNIHLENAQVKSGSVSANAPSILGTSSVGFDVELNTPGEYYEFTVDVVNDGSIDAMIDSVVKTPNLTSEQVKYIKYEITYENGESIGTKQTLKRGTCTPIKVRVEYRKDIVASDLPSSATELSLKLTLVYVQSDGTGSTIPNNGAEASLVRIVSGDGTQVGDEVCIKDECFYVISSTDSTVTMLAKKNITLYDNPIQSFSAGTTAFSNDGTTYEESIVEGYVNNYKSILEADYGVDVVEARLISYDELTDSETFACVEFASCSNKYPWIYSTSYWSGTPIDSNDVWRVGSDGRFNIGSYYNDYSYGVRPVIIISRDYL